VTQAGLVAGQVDALLICTCTGYLCPGVTSYVAEQLGLRTDAFLQDLVGLGCGAAIPSLRAAEAILAAQPAAVVACVAAEVCSAAFYLDDDPGVLVSACLFGDGAAATIWRDTPGPRGLRCHSFTTLHQPANRDRIRFEMRQGKLRNLLHPSVPALAAAAVGQLLTGERTRSGGRPISRIIAHVGGRDVLDAIEQTCAGYDLTASRQVLRECGNLSSPSVLFALDRLVADELWSRLQRPRLPCRTLMVTDEMPRREYPNFEPLDSMETSWG
jgi:alkylresorcinol/alkylpyrone synthase